MKFDEKILEQMKALADRGLSLGEILILLDLTNEDGWLYWDEIDKRAL